MSGEYSKVVYMNKIENDIVAMNTRNNILLLMIGPVPDIFSINGFPEALLRGNNTTVIKTNSGYALTLHNIMIIITKNQFYRINKERTVLCT